MKILGVGLSRTGTLSLNYALNLLGYNSIHWSPERLSDIITGTNNNPKFNRYDDVDAVTDIPAAYFYKEIFKYYNCKIILTIRDKNDWFNSITNHYINVYNNLKGKALLEAKKLQTLVYGSATPTKYLYIKKYEDHNYNCIKYFKNILILPLEEKNKWRLLCEFLGHKEPNCQYPKLNQLNKGIDF